jgi:pyruvate dehydrogenase E2 component (dihydrolipoamide acetyltransferase)
MAAVFVMPKLGLTMEEGLLADWLCETGQAVTLGQVLCVVETDKLSVEVETPYAGVLLRRIDPGLTVPVGEPIAVIGAADEDPTAYSLFDPSGASPHSPGAISVPDAETPLSAPTDDSGERAAVSPVARRLATSLGVDLAGVRGTGPEGRVTKEDVERAAKGDGTEGYPTLGGSQ